MSTMNNRRREPGKAGNGMGVAWAAGAVLIIALSIYGAVRVGSQADGVNAGMSTDPSEFFSVVLDVFRGTLVWPATATLIVSGIGVVLAFFAGLFLMSKNAGRKNRSSVDHAARFMATSKSMLGLQQKEATRKSVRLGVTGNPGVPLGRMVAGGKLLYASFEDMMTVIAGPRVGKSTSLVIPAITAAPGAVVTTSNKRDVLDATRDLRKEAGPVWVFDPQRVARENATWWWNPLTYVTDDTRAAKLADYFAAGSRKGGGGVSGNAEYFESMGKNLLSWYLLAAATAGRPIRDVYTWTTEQTNEEAVGILRRAGYRMQADGLLGAIQTTEKTRSSFFSTAQEMASCLQNTNVTDWINSRGPADEREQFNPGEFVTSDGTLYSLSKEGAGTAGPLVTALTAATLEAATDLADVSASGRLQTPLVAILDEAANVCRWNDLPDLYSHFGSRGIPIMSVFQSWSQGVAVFGKEGMLKLWSASNMFIYAGGVRENDFLQSLSELIGTYDRETSSVSHNKGVRSTSTSLKRERILEVDELANMPRGRAVMLSSGQRAVLLRTVPWYRGAKKTVAAIKASIKAHDPAARQGAAPDEEPPAQAPDPTPATPTAGPTDSMRTLLAGTENGTSVAEPTGEETMGEDRADGRF